MAPCPLDLQVLRRGRPESDTFQVTADPADPAGLATHLQAWLIRNKWHRNRWVDFELTARPAGRATVLATVTAAGTPK